MFLKLQLKRVNDVDECVKIAEAEAVLKNQMQVFKAKGQQILVVNVEGKFYAFEIDAPTWNTLFSLEASKAIH